MAKDIEEKNNKKYASQVVDVTRSQSRLSFADRLIKMTDAEGDPYLNIFSARSIYLASIFNFDAKKSVIANIPIRDLPMIIKRTDCAEDLMFRSSYEIPVSEDTQEKQDVPPAFTPLKMGKDLAGKTPGDILLSSTDSAKAVTILTNQLKFLKSNLNKYPDNKHDIEAIEDALNCQSMGLLADIKPETEAAPQKATSGQYVIYKSPIKHQKAMRNGKHKCYSIEITCSPHKDSPYRVKIMNCYAPLKKLSNGLTPIDMSNAEDKDTYDFDLLEGEWLYALDCLSENLKETRACWYSEMRQKDEANRWTQDNAVNNAPVGNQNKGSYQSVGNMGSNMQGMRNDQSVNGTAGRQPAGSYQSAGNGTANAQNMNNNQTMGNNRPIGNGTTNAQGMRNNTIAGGVSGRPPMGNNRPGGNGTLNMQNTRDNQPVNGVAGKSSMGNNQPAGSGAVNTQRMRNNQPVYGTVGRQSMGEYRFTGTPSLPQR